MTWDKRTVYWTAAALVWCALPLLRAAVQEQRPDTAQQAEAAPQQPTLQTEQPEKAAQKRAAEPIVLIDPSHGGDDKGAVFTSKLAEKDVTLSLGRELRKQLEERGIPARMLREADVGLSLDRRAEMANEPHTALYVSLHAGRPGKGVRVYAPLLSSTQPAAGRFLPWESAQAGSLERSRKLAVAVTRELRKKNMQAALLGAPLRPLNSIVPPAIAVELAPDPDNVHSLESEKVQTAVASAIASAVAQTGATASGHP